LKAAHAAPPFSCGKDEALSLEILTVTIACGSEAEAGNLARLLVEQKLAACVQTCAIVSTYRWQGAIETSPEVLLTAKTLALKLEALEACVKAHHSYEVPEILAVPVAWASADYLRWLREILACQILA
jgi:uncharacterized protein involved in tolerance to divalent cations